MKNIDIILSYLGITKIVDLNIFIKETNYYLQNEHTLAQFNEDYLNNKAHLNLARIKIYVSILITELKKNIKDYKLLDVTKEDYNKSVNELLDINFIKDDDKLFFLSLFENIANKRKKTLNSSNKVNHTNNLGTPISLLEYKQKIKEDINNYKYKTFSYQQGNDKINHISNIYRENIDKLVNSIDLNSCHSKEEIDLLYQSFINEYKIILSSYYEDFINNWPLDKININIDKFILQDNPINLNELENELIKRAMYYDRSIDYIQMIIDSEKYTDESILKYQKLFNKSLENDDINVVRTYLSNIYKVLLKLIIQKYRKENQEQIFDLLNYHVNIDNLKYLYKLNPDDQNISDKIELLKENILNQEGGLKK